MEDKYCKDCKHISIRFPDDISLSKCISSERYNQEWYDGVKANPRAYTALATHLEPGIMKSLGELAEVSKAIVRAKGVKVNTGKALKGFEKASNKLWEAAKAIGKIATFRIDKPINMATNIASRLMGKSEKAPLHVAIDNLLTSQKFLAAVSDPEAAKALKTSTYWKKIYNELGQPEGMADPVKWFKAIYQADKDILEGE